MISLPLPLAGFFAWLHALVPAQAEGLLDLVLPSSYDALPFDVAVVVAPEQSGAGEVSAAGAADFQVIFHRGTLLPCFEMLEFSTSVPNQTIHKTAFYIGYEGETLNGCGFLGCGSLLTFFSFEHISPDEAPHCVCGFS